MSGAGRLRVVRKPRLEEVVLAAQGRAVVLALKVVILVLEDAGGLDALEVADLIQAEPPIDGDPMAQTFALLMMGDLVAQLRGYGPDEGED